MPGPNAPGDTHVNRLLTNLSIAYLQDPAGFVASKVFPTVPVPKRSDRYAVYSISDLLRDEAKERASGTESVGIEYDVDTTPNFYCRKYGLHKDLDYDDRDNEDNPPIDTERDTAEILFQKLLIRQERIWATNFFGTGIWTTERAGVASGPTGTQFLRWDDGSSTPIEDLRGGLTAVQSLTGFRPTELTLGRYVYDALVDHPDVVGRLNSGQTPGGPAKATRESLASLLEIRQVLVMDAVYNSAIKGAADAVSFIGGKNALLSFSPERPSLLRPTAGYNFAWKSGMVGTTGQGSRVRRFNMDPTNSVRIESDLYVDLKLVAAALGAFFLNAVS